MSDARVMALGAVSADGRSVMIDARIVGCREVFERLDNRGARTVGQVRWEVDVKISNGVDSGTIITVQVDRDEYIRVVRTSDPER